MSNTSPQNLSWTLAERILFRFFFILFTLFIVIKNNGAFPFWGEYVMKYPTEFLHKIIPWIGKHVLNLSYDITLLSNGSGDTTYDYVIIFTILTAAIFGTIIWSILDRNRTNYSVLYYWLTVAVRYYVGLMLISYGLIKNL